MPTKILETLLRVGAKFASSAQVLSPTPPSFQCWFATGAMFKTLPDNIERGSRVLGELAAFLWDEAILTIQDCFMGKSVSSILQLILAPAAHSVFNLPSLSLQF